MPTLYVIATPIGNLEDLSQRARRILAEVDVVAAEDTRHTRKLLDHLGVRSRLEALHDHNEAAASDQMLTMLKGGADVALVSDAGTPLISDPGYTLVRACLREGIAVVPVPGPSALTTALSVSGLPTDRFTFEGFLPARANGRHERLDSLRSEPRTMVFYEAPHRIRVLIESVAEVLGDEREVTLCRELTKKFEQVVTGTAAELVDALTTARIPEKGEFVVVVAGAKQGHESAVSLQEESLLKILLQELPPARAASVAAKLTGEPRKRLYDQALTLKAD